MTGPDGKYDLTIKFYGRLFFFKSAGVCGLWYDRMVWPCGSRDDVLRSKYLDKKDRTKSDRLMPVCTKL